jgi:galactokinase
VTDGCAFHVPGRIEVLGKHTDYAGGRSLLAATERGITIEAVPRADAAVHVLDVRSGERAHLALDPALPEVAGWGTYPATVARRLARDFPAARTGADVAFASDLPPAAGVSSSSALVVAVFHVLATVNRLTETVRWRAVLGSPEALAGYLGAVESGADFGAFAGHAGVGTHGGSEDHAAMLCAREGALVRYAFVPVRFEAELPLPAGHTFVVAASGVRAEKAGAARERYNRASALARVAAELWRRATGRAEPTVGALLDVDPAAVDRLRDVLRTARDVPFAPEALLARVEHFVAESTEIVPAASAALARGDLAAFGAQVDRSQALAERLLGNQVPETVHLARSARTLGAVAASAFGAGFGGSVWALVSDDAADRFTARWRRDYEARFPDRAPEATFFRTRAGPPLARLR